MLFFDYAVLAICGASLLLGLLRGFVREVLSLLSWVAAFWVARNFTGAVETLLPPSLSNETLRFLAAFGGLFLAVLLGTSLLTLLLGQVVRSAGLDGLNRFLGCAFGFIRGLFIVTVLVAVAGMTSLPHTPYWKGALLSPAFEDLVLRVKPVLPGNLAQRVQFE